MDRANGLAMYCHQIKIGDFFVLNTYKGKLWIKRSWYPREIDWNHHHQHFLFIIWRIQWKWHGCTCFSSSYLFQPTAKPNRPKSWKWRCYSCPYIFIERTHWRTLLKGLCTEPWVNWTESSCIEIALVLHIFHCWKKLRLVAAARHKRHRSVAARHSLSQPSSLLFLPIGR